ncbi:stage V sporulation protein B [Thermobacillus composti KWC4]|uniref:Stage V sporulation protein B n=1 Tax=Thermobacillus composti (strain DSM 18247 / JCM 13945 / KWC4) TaxID=717605 RepID=L0EG55_THECK|nr:stage V sporulation protein B [Thermobacillus composti]AGA58614.1 stage V sporulation protein B [Thermobacillus composti KWC4]
MTRQTFIQGAMILLAAGIINRILGFIPRIALPRIIGAEGVGLYQLGYPFMSVLVTIVTGGIPLAVAKWVAEARSIGDIHGERKIFRTAMTLAIVLSTLLAGLAALAAPWVTTRVLTDPRVYTIFMWMLPVLPITAVSAVFRGYFQGCHNMMPTAVSTVAETVVRIAFVLLLSAALLPYGLEWAAAGAMMGVVAGESFGLVVLLVQYVRSRQAGRAPEGAVAGGPFPALHRLLGLAVPVTGSRLVGSLSYLFESIFTARSLAAAGIATGIATAQYGALQGMIMPVALLPTALTYSLAVSLVPSLSEAAAGRDRALIHKRLHQSTRIALVAGAPFAVAMYLFAEPICRLLYDHAEIAPMLRMLAPAALFIYLQAPLQAALQSLDKPGVALTNTFIGAAVKLTLIVLLASRPDLGIYGALIAIIVNIVLVTALHGIGVARAIGFTMKLPDFVKVGSAMTVMGAASLFVMKRWLLPAEWMNLLLALAAGTVVYLLLMVLMRMIDRHDVVRIPFIGRIFR